MKITGDLQIEGITLHVAIDAPDGAEELFVANVDPTCLIIPKNRWKVEFLGLPSEVVAELARMGITTLDQLIHEISNRGADGLSDDMRSEIRAAIEVFFDIALVFERPTRLFEQLSQEPAVSGASQSNEERVVDIASLGLTQPQEQALRNTRGVQTVADLVRVGRSRLTMTASMDEKGMRLIEDALRQAGYTLSD